MKRELKRLALDKDTPEYTKTPYRVKQRSTAYDQFSTE